jgi:hypothetical protein
MPEKPAEKRVVKVKTIITNIDIATRTSNIEKPFLLFI